MLAIDEDGHWVAAVPIPNSGDSGSVKLKGNGGSDTFNIATDQASTIEDLSSDVLKVASGSGNVTATVTADFTTTAASTNNLSLAGVTLVATDNTKVTLTSTGNNYGYTVTGKSANPDGNGSSVVGSSNVLVVVQYWKRHLCRWSW